MVSRRALLCIAAVVAAFCSASAAARANPAAPTPGSLLLPLLTILGIDLAVDAGALFLGNRIFTRHRFGAVDFLKLAYSVFAFGIVVDLIALLLVGGISGRNSLTLGFIAAFAMLFTVDTLLFALHAPGRNWDRELAALGAFMAIVTNPFLCIWLLGTW